MFLTRQYASGAGGRGDGYELHRQGQYRFYSGDCPGYPMQRAGLPGGLDDLRLAQHPDKIMAIIFPITAFVAAGFEHSVANMYFVPYGLFIQQFDPAFVASLGDKVNLAGLSWGSFLLNNLLPVTIGDIIGGAGLVGSLLVRLPAWNKECGKHCKKAGTKPEQKAEIIAPHYFAIIDRL